MATPLSRPSASSTGGVARPRPAATREAGGDQHHGGLADEEELAAIDAVGREAAEEAEDQHGAELGGREGAEHDGGAGLLGHEPLDAEALHPRADRGDHGAEPHAAKRRVAQDAAPKPPGDELGGPWDDRRGGRVDLQVLRDGRV
jgi:hypothetical protein